MKKPELNPLHTLYQEIAMYYEKRIRNGELRAGDKLPSTFEIARTFNVNPETVQQGLRLLINQGLISRTPKRGTIVKEQTSNKTLGIIFSHELYEDPDAKFFPVYFAALAHYAVSHGWNTRYFVTSPSDKPDYTSYELRHALDKGELTAVVELQDDLEMMLQHKCPIPKIPFIETDSYSMFSQGLDHLIERGRRNIIIFSHLAEDDNAQAYHDRVKQNFRTIMAQPRMLDVHAELRFLPGNAINGYKEFKQLWKHARHPDGLLIDNDTIFNGAWYAIMELGIKVPDELGVVTHVNKGLMPLSHLPLTRLETSPKERAKMAFDAFLALFSGKKIKIPMQEPVLVRGSTT